MTETGLKKFLMLSRDKVIKETFHCENLVIKHKIARQVLMRALIKRFTCPYHTPVFHNHFIWNENQFKQTKFDKIKSGNN